MILQALCAYYDRVASESSDVALPGYALTPISKGLVLDKEGNLLLVQELMEEREVYDDKGRKGNGTERKKSTKRFPSSRITPQQPKRAGSRPEAAFLCDNANFIFGIYKDQAGADYRFEASQTIHEKVLAGVDDEGAQAVLSFFARRTRGSVIYPGVDTSSLLEDGGNLVFLLLDDEGRFIHERPMIQAAWERYRSEQAGQASVGQCLVTGEIAPIARIHGNLNGFGQDKPTLVGFNKDSFTSYGKVQGDNAPVSETAAFKYVTALNLLIGDSAHSFHLHGDKVLFWAEKKAPLEEALTGELLAGGTARYKLDAVMSRRLEGLMFDLYKGSSLEELELNPDVRIYMLGVTTNKTRLVVRFFHINTFGDLVRRMQQHQADIYVEGASWEPEYPTIEKILLETALRRESKNVPPPHQVSLIRSIMNGTPYPHSLLMAMLGRIRAEAATDASKAINRIRIGVIKGCLNRMARQTGKEEMIPVSFDSEEKSVPYLLGQIFAILNQAQYEALDKVNATIVDKFLNAALASPQQVFPSLLTNAEHHFSKSEKYFRRKQLLEVMSLIPPSGFPVSLNAEGQGQFLVGFYHQQREFYRGAKEKNQTGTERLEAAEVHS